MVTRNCDENDEEVANGQDFHGTAVLSTIAGNAPGEYMGVAFDAEFLLAKLKMFHQKLNWKRTTT